MGIRCPTKITSPKNALRESDLVSMLDSVRFKDTANNRTQRIELTGPKPTKNGKERT